MGYHPSLLSLIRHLSSSSGMPKNNPAVWALIAHSGGIECPGCGTLSKSATTVSLACHQQAATGLFSDHIRFGSDLHPFKYNDKKGHFQMPEEPSFLVV